MTLTDAITKTARGILAYLRRFEPRHEVYAVTRDVPAGEGGHAPPVRLPCVVSNPEAFKDLEIGVLMRRVFDAVPRQSRKAEEEDLEYIEDVFRRPAADSREIEARQETITELQRDGELWRQVLAVKERLDILLHDESFRRSLNGLKALQDAGNIVELIAAIRAMKPPGSARLRMLKDLGLRFDGDERFREAEIFMRDVYLRYELGDVIDTNIQLMRSIAGVETRREFYRGNRIILEATTRMLTGRPFADFLNDEAKALQLLETMKTKFAFWHKQLFGFALVRYDLEKWGKNERDRYTDLMEYWLALVNEAVSCRIPRLETGALSRELGFYLGAAAVQRAWAESGVPVTNPRILDKRARRAAIRQSFNTTLLMRAGREAIVPNDIVSDGDRNLFVITGPNNGGKTTYIRQVGQMYWLAHLGMAIPAEEAQMSLIDALFTSFATEDDTTEGTGLYLTELRRIAQFTRPAAGQPRMTPYSLVFFDEFANGTDHEESVRRTRIVLDYLSKKGVTAYFTTHKHEIAALTAAGSLRGAVNLAPEVRAADGGIVNTYRMLRDRREGSYGHIQAEAMGITPEALHAYLMEEVSAGLYPLEDTRLDGKTPAGR